jgi:hypothetical protein
MVNHADVYNILPLISLARPVSNLRCMYLAIFSFKQEIRSLLHKLALHPGNNGTSETDSILKFDGSDGSAFVWSI